MWEGRWRGSLGAHNADYWHAEFDSEPRRRLLRQAVEREKHGVGGVGLAKQLHLHRQRRGAGREKPAADRCGVVAVNVEEEDPARWLVAADEPTERCLEASVVAADTGSLVTELLERLVEHKSNRCLQAGHILLLRRKRR